MIFDERQLGQCVACGLCLPSCPTYSITQLERHGPRGRIAGMRLVQSGEADPADTDYAESMETCVQCRACEAVCPSHVQFGALIEEARTDLRQRQPPRGLRALAERIGYGLLPRRGLLRAATLGLSAVQALRLDRTLPRRLRIGVRIRARDVLRRLPSDPDPAPSVRAGAAPGTGPTSGPNAEPGTAPAVGTATVGATGRDPGQGPGSAAAPGAVPDTGRGADPATGAGTLPTTAPGTQVGAAPDTDAGTAAGVASGAGPATGAGTVPTSGLAAGPSTAPGAGSGAAPGTGGAAGPATAPSAPGTGAGTVPTTPAPGTGPDRGARVAYLFRGCVMDQWFRPVHAATLRVLQAAGYATRTAPAPGCCGALHLHAGRREEARRLARDVVAQYAGTDGPVVVNSGGCGAMLEEYGELLGTPEAHAFAARVTDFSEAVDPADLPALRPVGRTVAYQASCHLRNVQRVTTEPIRLLTAIPGLTVTEPADDQLCCGAGGAYSVLQPDFADPLAARKTAALQATGADTVATANPGCALQLARAGLPVAHPAELLAQALGPAAPQPSRTGR